MKFSNENIKREYNLKIRYVVVGIILSLISLFFAYSGYKKVKTADSNMVSMNVAMANDMINTKSYININYTPYYFGEYDDDGGNAFYIVSDSEFFYIAKMSDSDYKRLEGIEEKNKSIMCSGVTYTLTDDLLEAAVNAFNEAVEEDHKISIDDAKDKFGTLYLDMSASNIDTIWFEISMTIIFGLFGFPVLISNVLRIKNYNRICEELGPNNIGKLDEEMADSKNSIYYKKAHLYLTENHIISFCDNLRVIKYKDLIWIYTKEYRTNYIKTSNSILVVDNMGNEYEIAPLGSIDQKSKDAHREIFETICSKNKDIQVGYSNDVLVKMKERISNITGK